MRYLVLSDIHGGSTELAQALTYFTKYKCDYLVLLGDLLNHGPRNHVPESYEPPRVAELLNALAAKIISVRGNCDSEVDSMMFNFPCNSPYHYLFVETSKGSQRIFLTHGHLHPIDDKEPSGLATMLDEQEHFPLRDKLGLCAGDIVLSGHTHVAGIFKKANGLVNINPGSTTIPKGGTKAGFAVIFADRIELRSLVGDELVASYSFA